MNCLHPLKRWDRGFESHSRHGCLCVRLFCVCVVLCAGSGLATGWSPVQGPTKGCRAIDEWLKQGKVVEHVMSFKFLGMEITSNGALKSEVMHQHKKLLVSLDTWMTQYGENTYLKIEPNVIIYKSSYTAGPDLRSGSQNKANTRGCRNHRRDEDYR
jgi:hypothetical protein